MRLSRPLEDMQDHYDVVVIGSGYGGAIAASRLSRVGRSVAVLERGREIQPGDYPATARAAIGELQARTKSAHVGKKTGLFDFHVGDDVSVLVGCGLGGTSLINANVSLRAHPKVFADERWPAELRGDGSVLAPYYERAERMLGATPYPDDWPRLAKLDVLTRCAEGIDAQIERPPINVTFTPGRNAAGVVQNSCNLCGDCVTGCNRGAKNTVLMNYLPDAHQHGADIFCGVEARTVAKRDGRWLVAFRPLEDGRDRFGAPSMFVTADVIVVSAGALGSTELLLRSREAGLPMSDALGSRFSGNGDVLGFAYDVDAPVDGIGNGKAMPSAGRPVGPCITGKIDLTASEDDDRNLIIEEGSMPGALGRILGFAFALAGPVDDHRGGRFGARVSRRLREIASAPLGGRLGPLSRTLTYLIMSTDDDHGRLRLEGDRVRVDWPGAGRGAVFANDNDTLRAATEAVGGVYVPNPAWSPRLGDKLVTVHPLGGCVMGDDATTAVVNHKGQAFSGPAATDVHEGLYVADGSVIPRPLDANPLLTISAVAERTCELLAADRGWDGEAPGVIDSVVAAPRATMRMTERMSGWFAAVAPDDFEGGARAGREQGSSIEFLVTLAVDDLDALLANTAAPARLSGTVVAPALSPHRLSVVEGRFVLLEPDPEHVETWNMRYDMTLAAESGERFFFSGYKIVRERAGMHAWHDTTTLFTTVRDAAGAYLGCGVLRISVGDFLRQMTTQRIVGVEDDARRRAYKRAFSRVFIGKLFDVYGGPLVERERFLPPRPKAPRRELLVPPASVRWFSPSSGWHHGAPADSIAGPHEAQLMLTRLQGGTKGPVLLAAGFGMAARSFLVDTVETNLPEALVAAGYDVWLFDYRASIDLPSARTQFTIDDIARSDWPEAVAEVRRITGADTVQAYGHCVGSVSLMMALLAGMEGVRSVVCAQFTTHPVTSRLNKAKADLGVSRVLRKLHARRIAPDSRRSLADEALDLALLAVPMPKEEHCGLAVCRWINSIYGCTHAHDQLNEATHEAIPEMFGVGNLEALDHLGRMMKAQLAVDHEGRDVYLTHPERLALPTLLVQGTRNYIFHPEGSERTLRWLVSANGPSHYRRLMLDGYAHLDALIGRNAARDVYPSIIEHLDETNAVRRRGAARVPARARS